MNKGLDLEHDDLTETIVLLTDKFEVWSKNVIVSKVCQTRSILPDIATKACNTSNILHPQNSNYVKNKKRGKKSMTLYSLNNVS